MKCLSDEIIQQYVDGETTPEQLVLIEQHLGSCSICAARVESQKKLAEGIKSAINRLVEDDIEVPGFVPSGKVNKSFVLRKRTIYRIAAGLAAACIIMALIVFNNEQEPEKPNQILLVQNFDQDVDANLPIAEQPLVIRVYDSEGNLIEYEIE